jgi:hypothetical protein
MFVLEAEQGEAFRDSPVLMLISGCPYAMTRASIGLSKPPIIWPTWLMSFFCTSSELKVPVWTSNFIFFISVASLCFEWCSPLAGHDPFNPVHLQQMHYADTDISHALAELVRADTGSEYLDINSDSASRALRTFAN